MAGTQWWQDTPGLRTLFGAVVTAASEGTGVAGAWAGAREAAYSYASHALNIINSVGPTQADINNAAALILQGTTIFNMNDAYASAKQLVNAHAALMSLPWDQQIEAEQLGIPPWSSTYAKQGVRTQYRIRVLRSVTYKGFTSITRDEWGTYSLTGPLTTIQDAIDQADALWQGADYNARTTINAHLSWSIEAI